VKTVIPLFASVLAASGFVAWKAPHLQLIAQLASGEIDGHPVPVVDFVPVPFQEETISIRCGDLVVDIPRRAVVRPASADEGSGFVLEVDGLKCRLLPPRHEGPDRESWLDTRRCAAALGADELGRQAAVCAASRHDLSFWMSGRDVESLGDRLRLRPYLCLAADRVEVLRGEHLSGLLRFSVCEGQPRVDFEYFSPDHRIRGRAFLFADAASDHSMRAARTLISTFRLEPKPPTLTR